MRNTFDQEKWRNENPMDYFKAVYLILSAPDKLSGIDHDTAMAITFKNLYSVIRLYVGLNCTEQNRRELIRVAKQLSVPIYQMQLDELTENYTLTERQLDA